MNRRLRCVRVSLDVLHECLGLPENFIIERVAQIEWNPNLINITIACDQFQEISDTLVVPVHGLEISVLEDGTRIGKMST